MPEFPQHGYFSQLCTVSGVVVIGGFLGLLAVATLIYPSMIKEHKDDERKKKEKHEIQRDYEKKYYEEFEDLTEVLLTKAHFENMKDKFCTEDTPFGIVHLTWNTDTETFFYYSDNKNIPYRVLDTVARKFSIDNNCKQICVNYKAEFYKAKEKVIEAKENIEKQKNETKNETKENSIFANFKSYNTVSNDNKNNTTKIVPAKANRFTYKGKSDDYIYKAPEVRDPEKTKLSFNEFKNLSNKIKSS
jgi:hypothetical protein